MAGWLAALLLGLLAATATADTEDFYSCVPGIKPSIGVSTPKGDIYVEVGSEPFHVFCHLNPEYKLFVEGGVNSSMLSFRISGSGEGDKIFLEPTEVESEIKNKTTIKYLFHPDKYGVFNVECLREKQLEKKKEAWLDPEEPSPTDPSVRTRTEVVLGGGASFMKIGFCTQRIFVGYPPQDVQNFACVSDNWESLNCTWDEPYNPVRTTYELKFKNGRSRYSPPQPCPNKADLEMQQKRIMPKELKMCYVDQTTHPPYRQAAPTLTYIFNASNQLLPTGSLQIIPITHYAVVRPGRPEKLVASAMAGNRLQITFAIPRKLIHFPPGLRHKFRYKASWDAEWTEELTDPITEMEDVVHMLENLTYSWTDYEVQVSLLSGMAAVTDERYWGGVAVVKQRTLAMAPPSPPRIHPGSFEIVGGMNDRTVVVFWQQLGEDEHNGANFTYTTTEVRQGEEMVDLKPEKTSRSYMVFKGVGLEEYDIFITSENSKGQAPTSAHIIVPAASKLRNIQPKSFTRTLYEQEQEPNVYELAWLPPTDHQLIVSYTVFWCKNDKDRPHYCEGRMDWEEVPVGVISSETLIHNITLPDDGIYQIAVAANTADCSSGLVWATCTIIKNRVYGKLKDVSVDGIGETTALVRWRLDCQDRIGILTGYQVVYCSLPEGAGLDSACSGSNHTKEVPPNSVKTELTGLTPWTTYKIMVRMVTRAGEGELSDAAVNRTDPSVPGSAPALLIIKDVLSNSASLSWGPPHRPNGNIDQYQIFLEEKLHNGQWREVGKKPTLLSREADQLAPLAWSGSGLKAYTSYRVSVAACNQLPVDGEEEHMACSEHRAARTFRTTEGKPGQPNQPVVTFKNSSIVELQWDNQDNDFQLGAPKALQWDIAVSRVGEQWKGNPKSVMKKVNGSELRQILDLRRIQEDEDWSPDCQNVTASETTNHFNFSIRAVVKDMSGAEHQGDWSRALTVPSFCQATTNIGYIAGITVIVALICIGLAGFISYSYKCIKKKKEMLDKIGRGLDDKMVMPLTERPSTGGPGPRERYAPAGGPGPGGGHRRDPSKDSLQNLLKDSPVGRGSDTTSGCESGQSSELGDREGRDGPQEGEQEEEQGAGEGGPLLSDYVAPPAAWLGPGDSAPYSKCAALPAGAAPAPYTTVGALGSLPAPEYVNQAPACPPACPPPALPSSAPSPGYVTLNSVKAAPCPAASPGYVTIAQLGPAKEPEVKDGSPAALPNGYSQVGLVPSGYVAWREKVRPEPVVMAPRALPRDHLEGRAGSASLV